MIDKLDVNSKPKTEEVNSDIKENLFYKRDDFLDSHDGRGVRILAEYLGPEAMLEKLDIEDTIVFFGSARIKPKDVAEKDLKKLKSQKSVKKDELKSAKKAVEMSRYYEDAVELSEKITLWSKDVNNRRRFVIVTGGGPGIMEAANRGARKAGEESLGFNITLPHEQHVNPYVSDSHSFQFHYFFMRKFWFSIKGRALIVFPGGFGTLDELFVLLTLSQTGIVKRKVKVIMYDSKHWKKIINFDALVEAGMINKADLEAIDFCDSVDEAFSNLTGFLRENFL